MDDAPRILGGRYEVGELIGRGGMAEVHIGHDTRLGRTVAIKILRSDLARDPSFQARFRREAQAAAALNHPAIVAVYDTGEDAFTEPTGAVHHVPFIVMEYVEGHTVRDILRDGSAVPIEEAVEITMGVLSALEYSHHAGIVHRDIKPANVMLTPTGAVKVMDFGIARAMADAAGTMTQTQAVIGTAQYLSPEQARGEAVDTRSDLYSTGCLLFELLTGRPPFIGDSPVAVAYQHAREQAPAPSTVASDVPEPLDRITVKALAKNREDRYATAAEFRADLEAAMRGGRIMAPPVGALGAAAAAGAATAVMDAGPATASTQLMGSQPGSTQVMGMPPTTPPPTQSPWEQVTGQQPVAPGGEPYEDEEQGKNRTLVWVLSIIGALALLGIVLVLILNGRGGDPDADLVPVPNVVGQEQEAARLAIEDAGLVFRPESAASADVAAGLVIETDPPAGEEVETGSTVTVRISAGPDVVEIPNMQNYTQQQAREALAAIGITDITVDTEHHPTIPEDSVIRTEPAAGEQVAPGTPVTLFLSTGFVELPDLRGSTEAEARQALTDLNLIPDVKEEESDEAPGTVIAQSREPGPVPQRSTVSITVAIERSPEMVLVPDVVGQTEERARELLGRTQLNVGEITYEESSAQDEGRVLRSEPSRDVAVPEGSAVNLVIGSGPADEGGNEGGEDQGGGD